MTVFSDTWDAAFEASPADTDNASEGALRIRKTREAVQERGVVDHSWAGDAEDGKHKKSTYLVQGSDPTVAANEGTSYSKDADSIAEFHYKNENADVVQITRKDSINLPAGIMAPYGVGTAPTGWLLCDGAAVSRTTYSDLFTAISTTFGIGDGSTTFNVPDFRGRVAVGMDNFGAGDATRIAGASIPSRSSDTWDDTIGGTAGEDLHQLTVAELAAHTHNILTFAGANGILSGASVQGPNSGPTDSTGGDTAHTPILHH